jgi:hypothetical protein
LRENPEQDFISGQEDNPGCSIEQEDNLGKIFFFMCTFVEFLWMTCVKYVENQPLDVDKISDHMRPVWRAMMDSDH